MTVPAARLAHLDGLRGLATVIVALSLSAEFVIPPPRGGPNMSLQNLLAYDFNMAFAGFVVFFALCGYLIPESFAGPHALRDFAVKRALRLYPTVLVAGVLALCLLPLSPGFWPTLPSLAKSFLLMRPLTASTEFNHSHWVLMVILVFYALCLATAALNLLHRKSTAVILAFGLLTLSAGLTVLGTMYHRHFPIAPLFGLAIAEYGLVVRQRQGDGKSAGGFATITVLFWSMLLLIAGFAWSPNLGMGEIWLGKVIAYAAGAALFHFVWRRQPTGRLLIAIGEAGYGMFFFLPLFLTAAHLVVAPVGPVGRAATAAGVLFLSYAAAAITYRLVGLPATELGRRLVGSGQHRAPVLRPPSTA